MRLGRPLAVDDETQVFHTRSHPDSFTCHVYAQTGRRSSLPVLVVKPDGLRLRRGDPQAQSAQSTNRAGRCHFAVAQRLVPPATSDQDHSQGRSQNRALRDAVIDEPPFLPFSVGVAYPPIVEVGADQPNEVSILVFGNGCFPKRKFIAIQYPGTLRAIGVGVTSNQRKRHPVP